MKVPPESVLIGYEIGRGTPVYIPLNGHLCVTGQTQAAGKTTTLEALITRSGRRALCFVTKKAEGSFLGARRIPPYFRQRADWQFVASILEATLRERMKFERAWIMRASKGAKTLEDVARNVTKAMVTARGMSADIYYQLHEYLQIVVPQVATLPPSSGVLLQPGINVMDLSEYSSELQALVIRSGLEWIYERERDTITVIPEAWEYIPAKRGGPVKLACEELIRKGGASRNYVALDSQDTAAIDRNITRSVSIWILGVQRDEHEIKRNLSYITDNPRPKASEIMALKKGQFFVSYGDEMRKVYVQPAWMTAEEAQRIVAYRVDTSGFMAPHIAETPLESYETRQVAEHLRNTAQDVPQRVAQEPEPVKAADYPHSRYTEEAVDAAKEKDYQDTIKGLRETIARLEKRVEQLQGLSSKPDYLAQPDRIALPPSPAGQPPTAEASEVVTIELERNKPEIEVTVKRYTVQMNDSSTVGRVAVLITENFFSTGRRNGEVVKELGMRGPSTNSVAISEALSKLVNMGFLARDADGSRYRAVEGMKVRIKEEEVAA